MRSLPLSLALLTTLPLSLLGCGGGSSDTPSSTAGAGGGAEAGTGGAGGANAAGASGGNAGGAAGAASGGKTGTAGASAKGGGAGAGGAGKGGAAGKGSGTSGAGGASGTSAGGAGGGASSTSAGGAGSGASGASAGGAGGASGSAAGGAGGAGGTSAAGAGGTSAAGAGGTSAAGAGGTSAAGAGGTSAAGAGGTSGAAGGAGGTGGTGGGCAVAFAPDTTIDAETGPNTSTAKGFSGTPNGNVAPGNVSKVSTLSLLYPGATTKLFAHLMGWFGSGSHYDVGYKSNDMAQAVLQVGDMKSRGLAGAIIDWYGPDKTTEDGAAQALRAASEQAGGFVFAIMEDHGTVKSCGCDKTKKIISDLTYAHDKYMTSSAYYSIGGRPVVFFFDMNSAGGIDWSAVRAQVPGNPLFIDENAGALGQPHDDGAFAWVDIKPDPTIWGKDYLDYFYKIALQTPAKHAFGSAYKGFDDTLASWSMNRVMNQDCGQTWLRTFGAANARYSAGTPLEALQLVTWNDYEEGTALEPGIDNCLSITAQVQADAVSWAVTGMENTLDHYEVFASLDGKALMHLGDAPTGTSSFDLTPSKLSAGSYQIFVKAVGRPSILNHTSAGAAWEAKGPGCP